TRPGAGEGVGATGRGLSVRVVEGGEKPLAQESVSPPRGVAHRPIEGGRSVPTSAHARELASEAAPTRQEFIDKMGGPPKKDISFFGFTVYKRDTAYKEVLTGIDGYQAALAKARVAQDGPRQFEALSPAVDRQVQDGLDIEQALERLQGALQNYVGDERHPHRAEMGRRLDEVRHERAIVGKAVDDLAKADRVDVTLGEVVGFRRARPELSLDQIAALKAKGYTAQEHAEIWKLRDDPSGVIQRDDIRNALEFGYGLDTVKAYHQARLPIKEGTRIDQHMAPDAPMVPLGKGGINTVYRMEMELAGGGVTAGVYKREMPLEEAGVIPKLPGVSGSTGVQDARPKWGVRSVATSRMDQQLGMKVTPPTHFAIKGGQIGSAMGLAPGRSPMFMGTAKVTVSEETAARLRADPKLLEGYAKAQGFTKAELDGNTVKLTTELDQPKVTWNDGTPEFVLDDQGRGVREVQDLQGWVKTDFGDPVLRRELTKLQWLDAITGQVDRHGHNYFVEQGPDGRTTGVKGIDNDMSFGAKMRAPPSGTGQALALPKVIDRATYDHIMAMTEHDVHEACAGLSPDEIGAAVARLTAVQNALKDFVDPRKPGAAGGAPEAGADGPVMAPQILDSEADWTTSGTDAYLGMSYRGGGTPLSYVARDGGLAEQNAQSRPQERQAVLDLPALHRLGLPAT
ncbi:MAG TPA: hypothetical protein VLJ58_20490, partial [Ramlibacter sp.]|nr:hypothetical protein [Ramlibacter sp.]